MSLHGLTSGVQIPLSKGLFATVSESDFVDLSRFKWCAVIRSSLPYAVRFVGGKSVAMHRVITGAPQGMCVDHINHDTLDNRRSNLRICTRAENLRNRTSRKGKSQFKGVSPSGSGSWRVDVRSDGQSKYVGTFPTEIEAAQAYDRAAVSAYGEFACLNFPTFGLVGRAAAEGFMGTLQPQGDFTRVLRRLPTELKR